MVLAAAAAGASTHSAASAVCCAGNDACTSAQVRLMLVSRCRSVGASALPTRTCATDARSMSVLPTLHLAWHGVR